MDNIAALYRRIWIILLHCTLECWLLKATLEESEFQAFNTNIFEKFVYLTPTKIVSTKSYDHLPLKILCHKILAPFFYKPN